MTEESERQTRRERFDPRLKDAGWEIIRYTGGMDLLQYNRYALAEFPTGNGPADYALCLDGKIIAVIEAKKLTISPDGVLTQAVRYAEGIVRRVGLLFERADAIDREVAADRRCERLTQAVLGKASSGKL